MVILSLYAVVNLAALLAAVVVDRLRGYLIACAFIACMSLTAMWNVYAI